MTRSLKGVLGAGRNCLTFGTQTVFYVFVSILTEKKGYRFSSESFYAKVRSEENRQPGRPSILL